MNNTIRLRPMALADLSAVLGIQRACYGEGFLESADVMAQRLRSPANLSCVAVGADGDVCAYLAAYRSRLGKLTPLHGDFEAIDLPDTLYLHDMAVAPAAKGQGLAQQLVAHLWALGRTEGLAHTALVSVQGSQAFWARLGYQVGALTDPAQQLHLDSYGAGACYMVKPLYGR